MHLAVVSGVGGAPERGVVVRVAEVVGAIILQVDKYRITYSKFS